MSYHDPLLGPGSWKRRRKGSVGFSGFSGGRGREWSEGKKGGRGCPLCCFDHKAQPRRDMYPACGAAGLIKLLLTRVSPVFSRSVSTSYRAVGSCHQAPLQHSRLPWCSSLFRLRSFNGGGWAGRGKAEGKRGEGGRGVNKT